MIGGEERLRVSSVKNKKTGTIWGRKYRAREIWELDRSRPSEGSVSKKNSRGKIMIPELQGDEGKDACFCPGVHQDDFFVSTYK